MKKFGFGKRGDDGDDANRSALFGRRKNSPAPLSDNPYAQQGADPYADEQKLAKMTPYERAKVGTGYGPGASPAGGKAATPGGPPGPRGAGYGNPQSRGPNGGDYDDPPPRYGYAPDPYGSGRGYGADRYGTAGPQNAYNAPASGSRGPGGYGGLGRPAGAEHDDNREALFSGAQKRFEEQRQSEAVDNPSNTYGQSGAAAGGGYGGYGEDRELTAEEQEEAEYQSILQEKRQVQQESASSVNRSLQMARQASEVGQATLARLGAQGERLHNTEKNLDLAANQNKIAQDRAAELKTLNRSLWAVHVSNPFTAKQREQRANEEVLARHRAERAEREATRRDGYDANQRMERTFRNLETAGMVPRQQTRKKDYGKYNLEGEEGADELEDQIDDGLTELEGHVSMMNRVGKAIGKEVDAQNQQIDRIMIKVSVHARGCFILKPC